MILIKNTILIGFICLFSFSYGQIYSDTTWERWYGEAERHENPWHYRSTSHYDNGFLSLYYPDQNPYASILQKTDVNGYIQWSKFIDAPYNISIASVNTTTDGSIIACGWWRKSEDNIDNPYIIKLNACGELEWCKKIYLSRYSFATDIAEDKNGDIIVVIHSVDGPTLKKSNSLYKFSADGELLWHHYYFSKEDHPTMVSVELWDLTISQDNSYYLSGYAGFPDYYEPGEHKRIRPTVIKINENGKEEWSFSIGVNDEIGAYHISPVTALDDNSFFGVMVGDTATGSQPGIFKFNNNGEVLDYYFKPVLEGITLYNGFYYEEAIGNELYSGILEYYINENPNLYFRGMVTFDLDLNVTAYLLDGTGNYPESSISSFDQKYIHIASWNNSQGSQYSDVYMAKYNADLSFADTIDDTNWEYDYLCDHAISSDTIFLFCDVVGIVEDDMPTLEEYAAQQEKIQLSVNPNPAKNTIIISMENTINFKSIELQIYDIAGNEKYYQNILSGVGEHKLKTRKWKAGMYIITIRSEGVMVGSSKFVIEK